MSKIGIVTDSIACIPHEMMEELDIHWVPYYIHRDTETLRDRVTATDAVRFLVTRSIICVCSSASTGCGSATQATALSAASAARQSAGAMA